MKKIFFFILIGIVGVSCNPNQKKILESKKAYFREEDLSSILLNPDLALRVTMGVEDNL